MHFLEEYALQQWDPIQQQMLLAQMQVYTPHHAATVHRYQQKEQKIGF